MLVKLRFILGATKNRALKGMNREEFKEYGSGSFQRQQKPIPTYWRTRGLQAACSPGLGMFASVRSTIKVRLIN